METDRKRRPAPPSRNLLAADWAWVLGQARRDLLRKGGALVRLAPVTVLPCQVVLTGKHGTNGRILLVRCRCQAQTRDVPRERFYGYDVLGEADSLAAALAVWRAHCGTGQGPARQARR